MHDAEYVLLGALAEAIATGDGEVEEDFMFSKPFGNSYLIKSKTG
jgi:hypothetical protein